MTGADVRLHVETAGPDPRPGVETFLLIHGFGASTFSWRYWAPRLARRGHVVMIDMKGFGSSPKPPDGRYAPGDQAVLVRRLVAERGLTDLTLVGHSLGGGVALLTALGLADTGVDFVDRLVVIAGAAYPQRLPPFVRLAEHPRLGALLFRAAGPRRVVRKVIEAIVHDPEGVSEEQVRGYAGPLEEPEALEALIEAARSIVPRDLDRLVLRYPEIEAPSLLLWGRGDRVVPLEVGERLSEALPRARLHVFESCGHIPAEEIPDESYSVLEAFLDETRRSRTD